MTLTFELNLERVKLDQCVKYQRQRSFRSEVIVRTYTHIHVRVLYRTTKVVGNYGRPM